MKTKVSPPNRQYKSPTEDDDKVPPIEDMEEDTDVSPQMETDKDDDEPTNIGGIDEKMLEKVMAKIQMKDRLKYAVDCKSKEELECMIKMCQDKIEELGKNPASNSNTTSPSRY